MRKDSPLAAKERITPEDLWDKPLIRSRQSVGKNIISEWFIKTSDELNIVATGNLLYNMSLLVEQGVGYAVSLDKIINTSGNSNLCFRPLYPELISHLDIAWKKYQVFPKHIQIFLLVSALIQEPAGRLQRPPVSSLLKIRCRAMRHSSHTVEVCVLLLLRTSEPRELQTHCRHPYRIPAP